MKRLNYIQISHEEGDTCIVKMDEAGLGIMQEECRALLEEGGLKDSITFNIIEMTEEEFENLPEFQGW